MINDDDEGDGGTDADVDEDINEEEMSPVIPRSSRYQENQAVVLSEPVAAIPSTSSTLTEDLQPLLTPRGSDRNMPGVPDCFRKVYNVINYENM